MEKLEKLYKDISELTFSDDFMFGLLMRKEEVCKGVISILLEHIKGELVIEKLVYNEEQKSKKTSYISKGVRFDVYTKDNESRVFEVEMQTGNYKNLLLRSRYYISVIDTVNLKKGQSYKDLKETFIIFICLDDPFDSGLPVYTRHSVCKEQKDIEMPNGTCEVFFNASAFTKLCDGKLKAFLQYVKTNEATDNFTLEIDTVVREQKEREEVKDMFLNYNMTLMDEREKGKDEGRNEGISEGILLQKERDRVIIYRKDARIKELERELEQARLK